MTRTKDLVHLSVNLPGDLICVDIFERPDGSFGFEEFRRDVEDGGAGWFPIGYYSHQAFATFEDTKRVALKTVGWLEHRLKDQ